MSWPGNGTPNSGAAQNPRLLPVSSEKPLRTAEAEKTPQAEKTEVDLELETKNEPMETKNDAKIETDARRESKIDASKISAYARLDFENYTFFVQTLQVVLGRKSSNELLSTAQHSVDVHLSSGKAISRRHAKIFYNFGTQRFEISVLGRNGAFVHNQFVAKGLTVPLTDSTKIQIGDIPFTFVLPSIEPAEDKKNGAPQLFNPSDALNLRTNLYTSPRKTSRSSFSGTATPDAEKLPLLAKDGTKRGPGKEGASLKADLVRRLSIARRKSLSSASADELNALISELEADPVNEMTELDEDVRVLLKNSRQLSKEEIEKEEDEIDRLVQQHNMQEGVILDDSSLDKEDFGAGLDVNVLDQEIASLAPLLDSQPDKNAFTKGPRPELGKLSNENKSGGRPVGLIRMGKAATIQPPPNKVYGRISASPPYPGYTPNYMGPAGSQPYSTYNGYPYQSPVQMLQVSVEPIEVVPAPNTVVPFRAITVDVDFHEEAPICVLKTLTPTTRPKLPLRKRDQPYRKPKVQSVKEVPEQFKTKPAMSISVMVSTVLKDKKLTLSEITDAIRDFFPYYKYCPDGWQFCVTHIVKYNKMFRVVHQPEIEADWVWALDNKFLEEKEKTRKRQHEVAMAKAKEAALRSSEFRQRQNMAYQNPYMQASPNAYTATPSSSQYGRTYEGVGYQRYSVSSQVSPKPKSIAEIASEIKRDPYTKTSLYFQKSEKDHSEDGSIKAQLAANRSKPQPADSDISPADNRGGGAGNVSRSAPTASAASSAMPVMNNDTKKSLTYLQKELFTLYKARKLSYNTAVTTEIITKALATTIAQVNIIGAKAGCGDNALTFLVEKAPQQVSKILDIALSKSIKERQTQGENNQKIPEKTGGLADKPGSSVADSRAPNNGEASPNRASPGLTKPSFSGGLSRPAFAGLGKPQGFNKPGALAKPPQFLSNKPGRLGENTGEKRPSDGENGARKTIRIDDSDSK